MYLPTQSPVDESWTLITETFYVSQAAGLDTNPGTKALPLKTLKKAAQKVQSNIYASVGTKVIVGPGTYRERFSLYGRGKDANGHYMANAPVVWEAETTGTAILSGSDVFTSWTQHETSDIYFSDWTYDWGPADNPWPGQVSIPEISLRKEACFLDGELMIQKLSLAEMVPGTYFVSELEDRIYVYPTLGTDINTALVEVSTRNRMMQFGFVHNLVIRGFKFQHACDYRKEAMLVSKGNNLLIEDCGFYWNNSDGLTVAQSEKSLIKRVVGNDNGYRGMQGNRLVDACYEDCECSRNNWRGDWGGFYSWDPGQKFLYTRNLTFLRYKAVDNLCVGLWLDTDNAFSLIREAHIENNFHTGLYIEANHHITIEDSMVISNKSNPASNYHHPGILISTSANVNILSNFICGNERSQIKVQFEKSYGPRIVNDFQTGLNCSLTSESLTAENNIMVGEDADQMVWFFEPNEDGIFLTFNANNNKYYNTSVAEVFQLSPYPVDKKNFQTWKTTSGQDANSTFAIPQEYLDWKNL